MLANKVLGRLLISLAFLGALSLAGASKAKTIAIEEEGDIVVPPTPTPKPAPAPKATKAPAPRPEEPKAAAPRKENGLEKKDRTVPRPEGRPVGMGDKVGLHYFVRSGYVVHDPSEAASMGRIKGLGDQISYSTPKKCKIELKEDSAALQVGDRVMAFRVGNWVHEERSGFKGYWVQNLAVLKVVEVKEDGIVAETVTTYAPVREGDQVKPFNEEMDRWNQASSKKVPPAAPVTCYVAGGDPAEVHLVQPAFLILTAGTDQGVVEGMTFEIRRDQAASELGTSSDPAGTARVFFAGTDHCLAQILHSPSPVHKGYRAVYTP